MVPIYSWIVVICKWTVPICNGFVLICNGTMTTCNWIVTVYNRMIFVYSLCEIIPIYNEMVLICNGTAPTLNGVMHVRSQFSWYAWRWKIQPFPPITWEICGKIEPTVYFLEKCIDEISYGHKYLIPRVGDFRHSKLRNHSDFG